MNNHKISTITKLSLFVCSIGLLVVLFTPIWRIDLQAPQYPEGLKMFIYANKLTGDVTIINGLNHYIGMKSLHEDDFKEFKILPSLIVFFSVLFIITGIAGKRKWLNFLLAIFLAFGIVAMVDFWRWEYEYGHNLNPHAAIIVPGMAYQPPLIGFKQLLNFGAYSIPATGGWIFVAIGVALLGSVGYEWMLAKKKMIPKLNVSILAILVCASILPGCSSGPALVRYGRDTCDFCKMTISDNRFGAEIVTMKNKVYKFDDAHCVVAFAKSKLLIQKEISSVYFTNFNEPHDLIKVESAFLLESLSFKSPMNGNIAAFADEGNRADFQAKLGGNKISWGGMLK